jgi:predicted amidophosphoribosyltransferase
VILRAPFGPRDLLDGVLPPSCAACDGPSSATFCARCAESLEPGPPSLLSCASFGGAVAEAVRRAKFVPDGGVARALGRLWCERIEAGLAPPLPAVDGVAFVPAPWRRRVARGFDLPALLAGALARHAGAELLDALACTRADAPLSFGADKAARAALVAGRYRARQRLAGRAVLLVDDVHTTGATLGEAASALEAAGADVVKAAFAVAP